MFKPFILIVSILSVNAAFAWPSLPNSNRKGMHPAVAKLLKDAEQVLGLPEQELPPGFSGCVFNPFGKEHPPYPTVGNILNLKKEASQEKGILAHSKSAEDLAALALFLKRPDSVVLSEKEAVIIDRGTVQFSRSDSPTWNLSNPIDLEMSLFELKFNEDRPPAPPVVIPRSKRAHDL